MYGLSLLTKNVIPRSYNIKININRWKQMK